jgi:hypothetical protein
MASRHGTHCSQTSPSTLDTPQTIRLAQTTPRRRHQHPWQDPKADLGFGALVNISFRSASPRDPVTNNPYRYVEPTFANRWCLQSLIDWMAGRPIPGDEGDKYFPQGFKSSVIGPAFLAGKGLEQAAKDGEQIRQIMAPNVTIAG